MLMLTAFAIILALGIALSVTAVEIADRFNPGEYHHE